MDEVFFDLDSYYNYMERQGAQPCKSPELFFEEEPDFPLFHNLSLEDKSLSKHSNATRKTRPIVKESGLRRRYTKDKKPPNSTKKIIQKLESEKKGLMEEIDMLKRKMECCPNCKNNISAHTEMFSAYQPNYQEEMRRIAGEERRLSRGSTASMEFENIDFHAPVLFSKEMDDRAWIYLGTLMIAMGSKCIDFDGTLNVFKVLKESVDSLRRQVDKSEPNICMDFFISQEDMQTEEQPNLYMQEIGYDPFSQKLKSPEGLCLEGVKLESVEQFDLIYDSKLTFNLKYEALLGAMEYLRENSWVTF